MFTGIVEEVGKVISARNGKLSIASEKIIEGLKIGDSISVNGVCLTATTFSVNSFTVDIMPETIERSNIGMLSGGDKGNLERALTFGGRLGGHLVQGHIDATGRVFSFSRDGEAVLLTVEAPPEVIRYVVEKGFIAIDGVSLTVTAVDKNTFQVSLVNITQGSTTLTGRRIGDRVNLEADIIAKYVERFSNAAGVGGHETGITAEFLHEHGFLPN